MAKHSSKVAASCLLAVLAIIGSCFVLNDGCSKTRPVAPTMVAAGDAPPPIHAAMRKGLQDARKITVAPAYNPRLDAGRMEYWEDDAVLTAAKETVLPVLRTMEARNAKLLSDKADDFGRTVAIMVTAPSLQDLGEIATKMTEAVAAAPAERRNEVREKLYQYCNGYTLYRGACRVVEMTQFSGRDATQCSVTELKNPAQAAPGKMGLNEFTEVLGTATFTNDNWKKRYGHLYDVSQLVPK